MSEIRHEQRLAAVDAGDLTQLRSLCREDRSQISTRDAQVLLEAAVTASELDMIHYLLTEFPDMRIRETAIKFAARKGSLQLFGRLVAHEPSVATSSTALTAACRASQPVEFLQYLLDIGAKPSDRAGLAGYPIAAAAAHCSDTAAIDLLLEHGAILEKSSALSAAAAMGNERNMRYLLGKGAYPDTDARPNADHPLHTALWAGQAGAAELLLDHGSSTRVLNRNGQSLDEIVAHLARQGKDRSGIMELIAHAEECRGRASATT
ncbi:serine/threonine-protein phosphatase 6 regulatory ankyrin repeat subunit B [Microdochium nivale]|nr:serine/threonine-protein phosphatase 6 regulatory ankyrin repeat subunit B [Microdochium nivale]